MNSILEHRQLPKRQSGAVLVVGLILLLVVTVLAISGMNTATIELAMARNDQNYENAFQVAESGLEEAIAQGGFTTSGPPTQVTRAMNANDTVTAITQFETSTIVPDRAFSLGVGSGIAAYHFNVTATAESERNSERDAAAVHTQSFYVIGPETSTL
ncbi:MAG: hypothetical protein HKN35_02910 [Woeseia sp.]|nr:pilus assembly PilX N-terminal domain-containing protein [Woeseia sp.]MBT8097109.1 pilus assembly PilX N-terminal domain-containing protein [Woeseia sp.]NNE59823.1 hypothetical protein [Woeseia sp.]